MTKEIGSGPGSIGLALSSGCFL